MGIPQLSQAGVVVIGASPWVNAGFLGRGGPGDQGAQAGVGGGGWGGGGAVPAVKRQICGAEQASELLGPGPVIGHGTRVLASRSIVNPDGSAVAGPRPRLAGRLRLAGCGRYAR